ncbi:retrovirus-related pol polyprotein from transposon TNT 1-94 [Tanacetum coccineum]
MINSQMDDMIREKLALKEQIDSLEQNLSKQIKENESLFKTFTVFKNESKEKENKYMENEIDLEKKIKELDNIVYKVGQSAQTVHMLTKPQAFYDNTHKQALGYQNPFYLRKAQRIKPTLYDGAVISKTHVAMPVIDDEETLILEEESRSKMFEKAKDPELNPTIKPSYPPPVIMDVPSELPKVSLVNASFKKLKFHLTQFDSVVKKRTTPSALEEEIAKKEILLENDRLLQKVMSQDVLITMMNSMSLNNDSVNVNMKKGELCEKCLNLDAELSKSKQAYNDLLKNHSQLEKHSWLQDKDTTISKLKDTIKSLKKNTKEKNVNHDKCDLEPINEELENSVAKLLSENERLCNEINHVKLVFKDQFDSIKQTRVRYKEQWKEIVENVIHIPSATTIAPGMFKLDLEPLPPRLFQIREVHITYLRNTQEQANILREIVEQAKAKQPLDSELDLACKYATRIQELLVYVESSNTSDSNTHVLSSTGVKCSTSNCGSKPPGNKKNDRISQTPSRNKKNKVESQPRKVNKMNRVVKPVCDVNLKHSLSNANSDILCATCNKSMFDGVHDKCLLDLVQNENNSTKSAKKHKKQNIWKPTGHVFTEVVQIVLWYLDSDCSKHMTGNRSQLMNFVSKFLGTIRFRNDQIARIMGYGDYQLGNIIISRVYYVEGLGHNLFFVGQFCDADLEVAFRKNTCFIRNLEGVDLLSESRDTNLYTISLDDMLKSSPICLLSKASKTKSWLWHRRLSHLHFGTLNKLAKDGLARGIPRLKFQKDHLCSACTLGKSKKTSHQPKAEDTNQEKLYLLHMDLCGLMRVASINGKRYILVIVDDYSRFTWVRFLKTKDKAPAAIIKCIKNIQVRLKATVRNVRTDNGTEFVNQTLREWYENVGISHQTFVARTPQQNGVVERRNRTLVEAARTMLIFSKAPLFLCAEAINTACYTQNRSLIRLRYNKTPYELMQDKKPDLSFFYVFGSLCYPTNDHEDLGKFDAKADIGIFVGYVPAKKAFRIYNRMTQIITETIHVTSNYVSQQPCIPPKRDDWDCLFQPTFDEYFNPPPIAVSPVQEAAALGAVVLADSPVSTSIDQDAPSTSIPSSQEYEQSLIISQGFEESPKTPTFHDDPLNESPNEDSTPQGSSSNVRQIHTPFEHFGRWTKDHPIANVIGDPSRSVSTRKQLKTDAMWCYFDAFLISVEPKNFKQAMTEPSWIDEMQEEIHEFERLEVWELVPCPDNVFLIKLKWIYKVKIDESGGVLKNKARLVAQGFRQKEGIDFEESLHRLLE